MDAANSPAWWAGLAVCGLLVGLVSGLFGVGGGFLLTPLLTVVFGIPVREAVGTGLCQMIGAATAGQIRYRRLQVGEPKIGVIMVGGGLGGVLLGRQAIEALSAARNVAVPNGDSVDAARLVLSILFVVLLGGIALSMTRRGADAPNGALGPVARLPLPPYTPLTNGAVSVPALVAVGLVMGLLSGLLGIGGGVILVPLLTFGIGMTVQNAAATGMILLLATSIVGTASAAWAGDVNLPLALVLMVGSTAGAQVGATLSARQSPERLRKWFAALVALTAAGVAADLVRLTFF